MKTATFNEALEVVESLPEEQRASLIEIVKNRLIEERRDMLAKNIKEAKREFTRGSVKRGTVDDLMRDLSK